METKKFKCKDEVIYRLHGNDFKWTFGIFSHYDEAGDGIEFAVIDGSFYRLDNTQFLLYEGNEHLVGTTDEPDEEVRLEEGECVIFNIFGSINRNLVSDYALGVFVGIEKELYKDYALIKTSQGTRQIGIFIKFYDFNPNDMEETKKHILVVKNGKIIKYKD